jgi:ribosomal protein S18 acetylase RimI-like enzyme
VSPRKASSEAERIEAFLCATEEAVCDEVRPARCGTALLTPGLPSVWQLNALRVEEPGADAGAVMAEADELLGDLGHRMLFVPDRAHGARLAPELARQGWNATRLLVMVRRRPPDRASEPGRGAEVPRRVGARSLAAFRREHSLDGGDRTILELEAMDDRFTAAVAARDFAAPPRAGLSCCRLLARDGVGQVDQVCTLTAHRNRGHARAALSAALDAAADLETVFLLTDSDDWPQHLYRKLGFEPAGVEWEFLKLPFSTASP